MNLEDGFPLTFYLCFAFVFGGSLGALLGSIKWKWVGFALWAVAAVIVLFLLPWRPWWTVWFSPVFWLSFLIVWLLKLLGLEMPWEKDQG
jgi:hypothetical protein